MPVQQGITSSFQLVVHIHESDAQGGLVDYILSGDEIVLTIAGGIITKTGTNLILNGQGDLPDDLDTINGGLGDGDIVILKRGDDIITVKHGTGNITLPGAVDVVLATNNDMLTLQWCADDTEWYCLSSET